MDRIAQVGLIGSSLDVGEQRGHIKQAADRVAAHLDDPDVRQLLIDATQDSSEAVRLRAVTALVGRPNAAAIPAPQASTGTSTGC